MSTDKPDDDQPMSDARRRAMGKQMRKQATQSMLLREEAQAEMEEAERLQIPGNDVIDQLYAVFDDAHSVRLEIDQRCTEFERELQGGSPTIEAYLANVDESKRKVLFAELLPLEVDARKTRGETPALEEYLARFSEYVDVVVAIMVD